jgi:hypothetical protein
MRCSRRQKDDLAGKIYINEEVHVGALVSALIKT